MKTLREYIKEAEEKKVAIGHFNISNLEGLNGVYSAAKKLGVPVLIGLTEGEEDFIGRDEAVGMIKEIRERDNYPIFMNADHHHSYDRVKASIDAGFDAVIFDGVELSFEENVKITKQCVDYAKSVNKNVLVEAELGFIGSGSNIKDSIPEGAGVKTDPEKAKEFVEMTGIDMFAPSVGNIHGLIKTGNPHIDEELIGKIKKIVKIPLVLHGGSGLSDEDFTKAIRSGVSIVHISTEIRVAYHEALKKSLADNPDEIAPYRFLRPAMDAIEKVVEARLKLFNNIK